MWRGEGVECIQLPDTRYRGEIKCGKGGIRYWNPLLFSPFMSRECIEKHKYTEEFLQEN